MHQSKGYARTQSVTFRSRKHSSRYWSDSLLCVDASWFLCFRLLAYRLFHSNAFFICFVQTRVCYALHDLIVFLWSDVRFIIGERLTCSASLDSLWDDDKSQRRIFTVRATLSRVNDEKENSPTSTTPVLEVVSSFGVPFHACGSTQPENGFFRTETSQWELNLNSESTVEVFLSKKWHKVWVYGTSSCLNSLCIQPAAFCASFIRSSVRRTGVEENVLISVFYLLLLVYSCRPRELVEVGKVLSFELSHSEHSQGKTELLHACMVSSRDIITKLWSSMVARYEVNFRKCLFSPTGNNNCGSSVMQRTRISTSARGFFFLR